MYIVTGKNGINKPVTLDQAIKHIQSEMYFPLKDQDKARLHFANGGSNFGVIYGFTRLDIERVAPCLL